MIVRSWLLVSVALLVPSIALAQGRVEDGAHVGYEIALSGEVSAERGSQVVLTGVAYEVEGLATLRPTSGLVIDATLYAYQPDGSQYSVASSTSHSTAGGEFDVAVDVPEDTLSSPYVQLRVHRQGQPGRSFDFPLTQLASRTATVMTDRMRYEPGETVHVLALVRGARDLAPVAHREIQLDVLDPSYTAFLQRTLSTGASGSVSTDVALPDSAAPGTYQLRITFDPASAPVVRNFEVYQRTTERVMATVTLDQDVVGPSDRLTGRVRVTTPSGAPIRGAQVELHVGRGSGEITQLTTDATGVANIDTTAPSFLSGEVSIEQAWARVSHPAYGTITASAPFTLSRTHWLVSAVPEAAGLVPELDSQLFLTVNDARGRPITAGATLDIRGLGIAGGHQHLTVDTHGIAVATVRLPRGAAARLSGGECAGRGASTTFDVEVGTVPPITTSVCAPVALEAEVLPRVRAPLAAPGAHVDVDLLRRPSASGHLVLLEAIYGSRAVASTWVAGNATSGTLTLPAGLQGVVSVRARPLASADARQPVDQGGATIFGVGASAAVLLRPADAFSLSVTPDRPLHGVRDHAQVAIATSGAPTQTWITLVARDEAQLGGEGDYAIEWILGELREAVRAGPGTTHDRFVRAALAAGVGQDQHATRAAPIVTEPWDDQSSYYGSREGILRDPIGMREELLRRGIGGVMQVLEQLVTRLTSDHELRDQVTHTTGRRIDFSPDVVTWLVDQGMLSTEVVTTLGGEPMTPAMITQADPSFTFDVVARRVARARLVRLLVTLSSLTNADDPSALRASQGAPPDRWLSLLVQLGMIEPDALVDPWGHAFVMRRVTGRHPAVVVSERAIDWELSSPGPDGVPGNADDVRDPFARVVTRGTPYAVVSGEDALMVQLSQIAPGEQVLAAMATAYQRLGLAAREEMRGGVVSATMSEATAMPMAPAEMAMDSAGYEQGYGGLAMGGPSTTGAYAETPAPSAAPARMAAHATTAADAPDDDHDGILDREDALPLAAGLIREDFPATLFYLGELALDATGHATVDVPLADAITTYRLEAIAWTQSGWITSGRGSVRVDQTATIDAPVPEAATIGDHIRIPVRVQNRTDAPLRVRVEIAVEGALTADIAGTGVVEVPGHEAAEQIVDLTLTGVGEGALVVRATTENGEALDAVRRPMHVYEDARLVRQHLETLVQDGASVTLTLPPRALDRGPAQLRLSVAGAIFGDPAALASNDPFWGGFAYAMDGETLPDGLAQTLAQWAHYQEDYGVSPDQYFSGRDPLQLALAIGALYTDARLDAQSLGGALRALAVAFPEQTGLAADAASSYYVPPRAPASLALLALAPAARSTAHADARDQLDQVLTLLRHAASSEGANAVDAPEAWARVGAALLLTRRLGDDDARAAEMLRRAERSVVAVGDIAWLEPDAEDGSVEPRVAPTALLALARIARGDRNGALALVRSLAEVSRGAQYWPTAGRAIASAAASMLATGVGTGPLAITLDGAPIEVSSDGPVVVASLTSASRPGAHELRFQLPDGALALLRLDLRYGLAWDVAPDRAAPVEIEWSGEIGARDTRSGMSVTVFNRGTRVLTRPTVDIEMPAGTELDEPTRDAFASLLAEPATVEGTTLHLVLRPIAPAGFTRIPVRARWSLAGNLRGLGVSFVDEAGPSVAGMHPTAILPSRAIEIADHGPEASVEHADATPAPRPPPPPPMPRPLAEVLR